MLDPSTLASPVLAEVHQHLVRPTAPVVGRVRSSRRCTRGKTASFVRHIEIDVRGTPLAGRFRCGQSFGVIPPGEDENGKPRPIRLYSIASPSRGEDGEGHVLSTTAKRLIDEYQPASPEEGDRHELFVGVASKYLCDLPAGAGVQVSGPNGRRFVLPVTPGDHDFLFVATGTGIAPFRGMVKELLEDPEGACGSRIDLVAGVPYTTDLLYDDLFTRLADEHPNFDYHPVISRESNPPGGGHGYVHDYIGAEIESFRPTIESSRTLIYMCGLLGMQWGMFKMLAGNGLDQGYLTLADDAVDVPPAEWEPKGMRRYVRPTPRCMVEVY